MRSTQTKTEEPQATTFSKVKENTVLVLKVYFTISPLCSQGQSPLLTHRTTAACTKASVKVSSRPASKSRRALMESSLDRPVIRSNQSGVVVRPCNDKILWIMYILI